MRIKVKRNLLKGSSEINYIEWKESFPWLYVIH